jgi:UDP-4-amino-4-deoxy-L-arabinose formyltransferase/UDP-glucuronic acid dehydrogenase (UDP-4-keto-hexauronic acid decarboxylating)
LPSLRPKGVIGLSDRAPEASLSGFYYGEADCRRAGLEFITVDDYTLRSPSDRRRLESVAMDALFVCGWQRLIPSWLIAHCRGQGFGFHGSPWGISGGRGRSPQNWALLMGEKGFELSMFRITESIDGGEVIAASRFPYSALDDIKTSYYKVAIMSAEMIISFVQGGLTASKGEQEGRYARYLPKRAPSDGAIDWNRSAAEVYDFIRALTHPYPGAFSGQPGSRLYVWRGRPLTGLKWPGSFRPGEVLQIFPGGDLLVGVGNGGLLLIEEYETDYGSRPQAGTVLDSVNFGEQMRSIIDKHLKHHPDLPVQARLMALGETRGLNGQLFRPQRI